MFEAGYGPEDGPEIETATFDTREEAQAWIEANITEEYPQGYVRPVAV